MAASDNLSQFQFRYTGTLETGGKTKVHEAVAEHPEAGVVGSMRWTAKEIHNIDVKPDYRRQGIATGLWEHGQAVADGRKVPAPKHSSQRTDDGDAWARTVGGKRPRRDTR